jgi:hypothetical protein
MEPVLDEWSEGYGDIADTFPIPVSHHSDMRDDLQREGILYILSIMKKYNKTPIVFFRLVICGAGCFTTITIDCNFNLYIAKVKLGVGYLQHYNQNYDFDITLNNEFIYTHITKVTYMYTADGRIAQDTRPIYTRHINEYKISEEWFKQDKLSNFCIDKIKIILDRIVFLDCGDRALPIIMKIQSSFIELNKKLRKSADIISRKITSSPIGEDYEKELDKKDALIASLQNKLDITSAELYKTNAIIATLQHECQTLTENLQSSKEELYKTNADHEVIITELECKCLELTMTISEKDAIIARHAEISEEEAELKASSIYYKLYPDYIDSIGNIYKKDNATVPDELLISYIDHMGYSKFIGDNFEIIYSKDKLCLMKHSDCYIINNNLPKIAKKLIKMLKKGVVCHRPSFIYTTPRDKLIGNDKSLDETTLKEFEYIGPGHREVYYNNGIFKYI